MPQAALVCQIDQRPLVVQGVLLRQWEARVVVEPVHVVRIHGIEPLLGADVHAGRHDGKQRVQLAHIEPSFTGPVIQGIALDLGGQGCEIGAEVLGAAGIQVTDDVGAGSVQLLHL